MGNDDTMGLQALFAGAGSFVTIHTGDGGVTQNFTRPMLVVAMQVHCPSVVEDCSWQLYGYGE